MRVVVTGMGAVSGLGYGVQALERGVFNGDSSVRPNTLFPESDGERTCVSFVEDVPPQAPARADHFIKAAIAEALAQAKLPLPLPRLGIFAASVHGNLDPWCRSRNAGSEANPGFWQLGSELWPTLAERYTVTTVTTGCTSSAMAVGQCLDYLRAGFADIGIVAAAEGLTPFLLEGFKALRALAKGNCRPFDSKRGGFVLGEGAAVLVLESWAHAEKRGAAALAEVAGFGTAADASNFTAPDPDAHGVTRALQEALRDAGLSGPPDSINAHGSGTKPNDRMECIALERIFGAEVTRVPITSSKPAVGHLFGAAGAIEIICSILGMRRDQVPPILTFEQADHEFSHFDFVHKQPRRVRQRSVVSLNNALGGTNSAVVLRSVPA